MGKRGEWIEGQRVRETKRREREVKGQRERDRGKDTEGKTQRERDRGKETERQ
jgi:hypothetical protein